MQIWSKINYPHYPGIYLWVPGTKMRQENPGIWVPRVPGIHHYSLLRKLAHNVLPNYSNPKHFTILKFSRTLCTRIIFESTESLAAAQFHLDAYCTFRKSTFMHEQWTWALKKILVLNIFCTEKSQLSTRKPFRKPRFWGNWCIMFCQITVTRNISLFWNF